MYSKRNSAEIFRYFAVSLFALFLIFWGPTKLYSLPQLTTTDTQPGLSKPNYIDIYSRLDATPKSVRRGEVINYTFTFINNGSEQPHDLVMTFYAPNEILGGQFHGNYTHNLQHISASAGISYVADSLDLTDGNLIKTARWEMAELVSPDSQKIEFSITVVDTLQTSQSLIGVMTLNCPPNFSNQNSVEVNLTLVPELTVTKYVDPPGPYKPGESGHYVIAISNNGQRDIDNVVLRDQMPDGLIIDTTAITASVDFSRSGDLFSWDYPLIEWYGDSIRTVRIPFTVDPIYPVNPNPAQSTITNTAVVDAGIDVAPATAAFVVEASDIQARIIPLPDAYSPGYPIVLQGSIKNIGFSPVDDEFRVAFFLNDTNTMIGDFITFNELQEDGQQTEEFSVVWENPPEGIQEIILFADYEDVVKEIDETNNDTSTTARVQVTEINLQSNGSTYYSSQPIYNLSPSFPDNIFSYISVLDQNEHPVRGLASTTGWVTGDGLADLNAYINQIWSPLTEHVQGGQSPYPTVYQQDAQPQFTEITEASEMPVTTTLVLPSLDGELINTIRDSLCVLVNHSDPQKDQFAVVHYSNHVSQPLTLSSDFEAICSSIQLSNNVNPTALMDAIYRGLSESAKNHGRRAVIAVTNGENTSYEKQSKVIELSRRLAIPVVILDYSGDQQENLQILAEKCGGIYHQVTLTVTDLYKKLYEFLNNYYILSHTTPNEQSDGMWRQLDLTLNYPNDPAPVGSDSLNMYLAPANSEQLWIDIASFPDQLQTNIDDDLWKVATAGETYEYVLIQSNVGNASLQNVTLDNMNSPHVIISDNVLDEVHSQWQHTTVARGQNLVTTFSATVDDPLPPRWLMVIDSASVSSSNATAATLDTVHVIQDVTADVRVTAPDQTTYPANKGPVKFLVNDSLQYEVKFWVELPVNVTGFALGVIPPVGTAINFTDQITNMPVFPTMPDTLEIAPTLIIPQKVTENDEEKWTVQLDYTDQLGNEGTATADFYLVAENKLILGSNISRDGTNVDYSIHLAKESDVKVDVYNVAGEHVRTLLDQYVDRINYADSWDCKDKDGRLVGSDVYILVMKAGSRTTWQKVIIVH